MIILIQSEPKYDITNKSSVNGINERVEGTEERKRKTEKDKNKDNADLKIEGIKGMSRNISQRRLMTCEHNKRDLGARLFRNSLLRSVSIEPDFKICDEPKNMKEENINKNNNNKPNREISDKLNVETLQLNHSSNHILNKNSSMRIKVGDAIEKLKVLPFGHPKFFIHLKLKPINKYSINSIQKSYHNKTLNIRGRSIEKLLNKRCKDQTIKIHKTALKKSKITD